MSWILTTFEWDPGPVHYLEPDPMARFTEMVAYCVPCVEQVVALPETTGNWTLQDRATTW